MEPNLAISYHKSYNKTDHAEQNVLYSIPTSTSLETNCVKITHIETKNVLDATSPGVMESVCYTRLIDKQICSETYSNRESDDVTHPQESLKPPSYIEMFPLPDGQTMQHTVMSMCSYAGPSNDSDENKTHNGLSQKDKTKKDRKVLHPQAKELILNVVNFMKQEANGKLVVPARKIQCRAAMATGFSERTIRRVVKESKTLSTSAVTSETSAVSFPAKKTPNRPKPKTGLDELTRCSVRKLIHKIYVNEKTVPTIKKIHQKLVEDIGFKGGSRSAHKIVKELGFYWKKTKAKSFVLMEKHDIRLRRIEYLRDITRFRHEARNVVYISETVLLGSRGSSDRVAAIMAGNERGLIGNSLLTVDGNKGLAGHLEGWVRDSLRPHLPSGAVVVLNSAVSCNQERVPTLETDADTMKKWLTGKGISFRPDMLRPELHQVIRRSAGRLRKHKSVIEVELSEAGYTVMKTPPDHPDLNAAAIIWADVKKIITGSKSTGSTTMASQISSVVGGMDSGVWSSRCASVLACEQQYLASEGIVDAEVERVLTAGKDGACTADDLDDPHDNNINFVRHFMGGLLGLDQQRLFNVQ